MKPWERDWSGSVGQVGETASKPWERNWGGVPITSASEAAPKAESNGYGMDVAGLEKRGREFDAKMRGTTAAETGAAGAASGTLGLAESLYRAPDAAKRWAGGVSQSIEDVTGLPRALNPVRAIESTADFIASGQVPGTTIRTGGATDIAERINQGQQFLAGEFAPFRENAEAAQKADQALQQALRGDFAGVADIMTDPKAMAGFVGQAAPSLVASYVSGGSMPFMAWMEAMEVSSNAAEFEKRTGQKVSDRDFIQAQAQAGLINGLLEKVVPDSLLKGTAGKSIWSVVETGLKEALTEGTQATNTNLAEKLTFNPKKKLTEGVLPAALGGLGSGTAAGSAQYIAGKAAGDAPGTDGPPANLKAEADRLAKEGAAINQANNDVDGAPVSLGDLGPVEQAVAEANAEVDSVQAPASDYVVPEQKPVEVAARQAGVDDTLADSPAAAVQSDVLPVTEVQGKSPTNETPTIEAQQSAAPMTEDEFVAWSRENKLRYIDTQIGELRNWVDNGVVPMSQTALPERQRMTPEEVSQRLASLESMREKESGPEGEASARALYPAMLESGRLPIGQPADIEQQPAPASPVQAEAAIIPPAPAQPGAPGAPVDAADLSVQTQPSGSVIVSGASQQAIRDQLQAAGVTAKGVPHRDGLMFGSKHAEQVRAAVSQPTAQQPAGSAVKESLTAGAIEPEGRRHTAVDPEQDRRHDTRRANFSERRRVEHLSLEEARRELLTNHLSGLPNQRAYDESQRKAHQVFFDLDNFKATNDELSYAGADQLLNVVGQVMREEQAADGVLPYHFHGDEFVAEHDDSATLKAYAGRVQSRLAQIKYTVTHENGTVLTKDGVKTSYGIGQTLADAESALKRDKDARAAAGLRHKRGGEARGLDQPPAARQQGDDHPPAESVAEPKQTPADAGVSVSGDFIPTHELPDGTPVRGTDEPGVWVDAEGNEWEDGNATPIAPSVDDAAHQAATSPQNDRPEPTEAQRQAGNYAKGHLRLHGLDISIENPAGSKRRPEWPALKHHYGYIRGTEGRDGDHVDVFLGPQAENAGAAVVVIDQLTAAGKFDEHKVMLGFASTEDALRAYFENYEPGWDRVRSYKALTVDQLKAWVDGGNHKQPAGVILGKSKREALAKEYGREATAVRDVRGRQDADRLELEAPDNTQQEAADAAPQPRAEDVATAPAVEGETSTVADESKAVAILNRANVTGKERLDIMRDFRDGKHTLADLETAYPENSDGAMFSLRTTGDSTELSAAVDGIQTLMDAVTARLPGSPRVSVIATMDDAPADVRAYDEQQRSEGATGDVEGFLYRKTGEVFLVLDGIATRSDETAQQAIIRVWAHEVLGHAGLRGAFGKELVPILKEVALRRRADVKAKAEQYGLDFKNETERLAAAEEVLAELAETRPDHSIVRRTIEAIRRVLRNLYLRLPKAVRQQLEGRKFVEWINGMPDSELIERFILPARGFIETGVKTIEQSGEPVAAYSLSRSPQAAEAPAETTFQKQQRIHQDKFNRFNVIENWLKEQGVDLPESASVYRAEERYHGRVASRTEDFRENVLRPLIRKIHDSGFTLDDVSEFLHAQHAEERNRQIARVNPQMPDGGSGMTNAEARAILDKASPELEAVANEYRAITDRTLDMLVTAGIIPQEQAEAYRETYEHYVPLKGGDEKVAGGAGKGFTAKNQSKRALGHGARDEMILENIQRDYERAIITVEKNRVGQHLLKLAVEAGRPDLITIGKPERRAILRNQVSHAVYYHGSLVGAFQSEEAAKTFVASESTRPGRDATEFSIAKSSDPMVAYMASPMLGPNETQVYVDGHAVRVQFNDELLARAYNNMGVEHLNAILRAGREVNSYLSRMYTGYSPDFILTNAVRDWTAGLINLTGEEGLAFAAKAAKNYPKAVAMLSKYAATKAADPMLTQYRMSGGTTGAAYLSDLERLGHDARTAFEQYAGLLENAKNGQPVKGLALAGEKAVSTLLHPIERLNMTFENAMRLSAFMTALESGMSREKAASIAKSVTVNFNRKGEVGAQVNALWLFHNASLQGTAVIMHALFKGKHKRQAQALVAGLATIGYLMAATMGGGDDDEYEKLPEHVKQRNLTFKTDDGWVTIPLPYGYGWFVALGRKMHDIESGKIDPFKAALQLMAGLFEETTVFGRAINPDDPDIRDTVFLLPTVAQLPGAIATNRSPFHSEIYPDSKFNEEKPDSQRYWRNTAGTPYAELAAQMNEATGGNEAVKGWVDVSPETLKYVWRTLTGGFGAGLVDAVGAVNLKAHGADPDLHELPVVRRFVREETVKDARARFWQYAKQAEAAKKRFDLARKAKSSKIADDLLEQEGFMLSLADMAKEFSDMIKAQRDAIDEIRLDESIPLAERRKQIKEMEEEESRLYDLYVGQHKEVAAEAKAAAQ